MAGSKFRVGLCEEEQKKCCTKHSEDEKDRCKGAQRVHVPNNLVLGIWVIVIIVLVLGKYMIIGYLDP